MKSLNAFITATEKIIGFGSIQKVTEKGWCVEFIVEPSKAAKFEEMCKNAFQELNVLREGVVVQVG